MLRRFQEWLSSPPIRDPVERRNAPMLQVVLLLLATLPPLMWAYRIFLTDIPWRSGESASLATSLFVCAMAAFSLVLVRRGRFRWAVRQVLVVVAVAMLAAYATAGLASQVFEQPIQVMWLFVAGAMLGQRALWAMFAVLCVSLFLGGMADYRAARVDEQVFGDAVIRSVMFLLIAIVVDRTSSALRRSLAEANERGEALAAANARLREEIAARERTQEQLLHAQRVEAVGRMASGVAHDFNHLLELILGYVARGRLAGGDPAELDAVLTGVDAAARRGVAVTSKLTSFSRNDAVRVERFDAAEAVRGMLPLLRQTLGASIVFSTRISDAPCPVRFDRAQLELILLNIAANAAHAMPDGGRATLAVQDTDDAVELTFADTGHGMTPEVLARALEPFYTTKPAGQGTGLGLSVASDLLMRAGGSIHLDSSPGEGTTVHIRLPQSDADSDSIPGATSVGPIEADAGSVATDGYKARR
jgi:signal transduction histidine kinase